MSDGVTKITVFPHEGEHKVKVVLSKSTTLLLLKGPIICSDNRQYETHTQLLTPQRYMNAAEEFSNFFFLCVSLVSHDYNRTPLALGNCDVHCFTLYSHFTEKCD